MLLVVIQVEEMNHTNFAHNGNCGSAIIQSEDDRMDVDDSPSGENCPNITDCPNIQVSSIFYTV